MSETVHGTAVLVGAHGVLLRGRSGAGKSLLASILIERGARLVADDRVHLSACHGRLVATVPGAITGRLELRGRGIVSVPFERAAIIRLVVDLVDEGLLERLPDAKEFTCRLLGLELPRQPVKDAAGTSVLLIGTALAALFSHMRY